VHQQYSLVGFTLSFRHDDLWGRGAKSKVNIIHLLWPEYEIFAVQFYEYGE
jgi:hypothetical protein